MTQADGSAADAAPARTRARTLVIDLISRGEVSVGDKLNEVALAAELGVSRNTLREAFATLAADGLVERIANRGVFVATPSRAEIEEIYRIRLLLETGAVQWSSAIDTGRLRAIVSTAQQARAAGDMATVAAANQDFHAALVESAESRYANLMMQRVLALMRLAFARASQQTATFHARFVDGNLRLCELIDAGDRQAAAAHMQEYLEDAFAEVRALVCED